MLDKNGYAPSILDTTEGICYLTYVEGDTCRHEIFFGSGNRDLSKKYGCWCYLNPDTHRKLHEEKNGYDEYLKKICYRKFCEKYGREFFYQLFRRYYDDTD